MHTISYDEIKNLEVTTVLACSYGEGENKSLKAIVNIDTNTVKYLVDNIGKKKADYFLDIKEAIKFYNSY